MLIRFLKYLMPSLVAVFLAGFHLGVDFGLWWSYPESVPFATLALVEFFAALGELCLIFRVDRLRFSLWPMRWPSRETIQKVAALLIGIWLVFDMSLRFLRYSGVFTVVPVFLPAHPATTAPLLMYNTSNLPLNTSIVPIDFRTDAIMYAWPNALLIATLTQLRVTAWMFMDYLVGTGRFWFSAWEQQKKVVYHILSDDSYVLSLRWGPSLGHASVVQGQQVAQMDWLPFLKAVNDWENVPTWIRVRISQAHPEAG